MKRKLLIPGIFCALLLGLHLQSSSQYAARTKPVSNISSPSKARSSCQQMQPASTQDLLPVFDLASFLQLADGREPSTKLMQQCRQLSECLCETGCLVVRPGRAPARPCGCVSRYLLTLFQLLSADNGQLSAMCVCVGGVLYGSV